MKRTLRRVTPLPFAKIVGALYALATLLFAPLILLGVLASTLLGPSGGQSGNATFGILFAVGLSIGLPIFYGVLGFLCGLIGAWAYNLLAGILGGIEVEIE